MQYRAPVAPPATQDVATVVHNNNPYGHSQFALDQSRVGDVKYHAQDEEGKNTQIIITLNHNPNAYLVNGDHKNSSRTPRHHYYDVSANEIPNDSRYKNNRPQEPPVVQQDLSLFDQTQAGPPAPPPPPAPTVNSYQQQDQSQSLFDQQQSNPASNVYEVQQVAAPPVVQYEVGFQDQQQQQDDSNVVSDPVLPPGAPGPPPPPPPPPQQNQQQQPEE